MFCRYCLRTAEYLSPSIRILKDKHMSAGIAVLPSGLTTSVTHIPSYGSFENPSVHPRRQVRRSHTHASDSQFSNLACPYPGIRRRKRQLRQEPDAQVRFSAALKVRKLLGLVVIEDEESRQLFELDARNTGIGEANRVADTWRSNR